MKINTQPADALMTRIFQEGERLRREGLVLETIDLTQEEYDQLVRETGNPDLCDLFGLPLLINGIRVPDPLEKLMSQLQSIHDKEQGTLPN